MKMGLGRIISIFLLLIAAAATMTTAATTATTATTTTAGLVPAEVVFRSVKDTFTNDLMDPSSAAFAARASLIKTALEPVYSSAFSSFKFLKVETFRSGSVINDMKLNFDSTSVPNVTEIANVLISASSNITSFDVDTSSITVNGISTTSSGVNLKISLITASCLVLLSWLLSSQQ